MPTPLPTAPVKRGQFIATVVDNRNICREHFYLRIRVDHFPPTRPGQFVQLLCHDPASALEPVEREVDWPEGTRPDLRGHVVLSPEAMLRRPFSLAGRTDLPGNAAELLIVHRVVGPGTDWLSRLAPGDAVGVLGPLGNAFLPPPPQTPAILVGGGVGIPPMMYLAASLAGQKAVVFAGATTRELLALTITADAPAPGPTDTKALYNIAEFSPHGVPAVISTDDGSYGFRGYVTDALTAYLDRYYRPNSIRPVIYVCGPEVMMVKVGQIAMQRNIPCQIAVERAMACGMGTCQSCAIRVRHGDQWVYRLACTDGPVFEARELMW